LKLPPPEEQEEMGAMEDEREQIVSSPTELRSAEERMLGTELVREMVARRERGEGVNGLRANSGSIARQSNAGLNWGHGNRGNHSGVSVN
jgi:hypothetical protein